MNEPFHRSDVEKAIKVLDYFLVMKADQLRDEPNEIMWKSQNWQLMGARELLEMDLEVFLTEEEDTIPN